MAAADSAQASAMATTSNARGNRPSSPTQTKRDKKRQVLNERLVTLADTFARDRDRHWREELQRIQFDVNLVGMVDPYQDKPIELEDIQSLKDKKNARDPQAANGGAVDRSVLEMAGPSFQDWVQEVEDLVEHRDYEMTAQKYDYERKITDHHNTHKYRLEVARREHEALSATLRDRLINAISSKKYRLNKEKDAIDLSSDSSSALLLHPNQFSLTNPASPGGPHGKRSTRQRRELEEFSGFSDNKKRKRNGGEEDGSPAPIRKGLDTSNTTPLWQNDRLGALRKETGPVYSIDKLFTDKELGMTYNTAALAAHKHLLSRRDANGNVIPSPDDDESGNGDANDDADAAEFSATTMERQPSHATRSTRVQNNIQNMYDNDATGIEALANFSLPRNLEKMASQEPKLPPLIHSQYSKAYVKSESNTPAPLVNDDVHNDLMAMHVFKNYQKANGQGSNMDIQKGGRRLLETMAKPQVRSDYVSYIQNPSRPSIEKLAESLGVPSSNVRDEALPNAMQSALAGSLGSGASPGGAPMSRQSSLGGTAMSRSGSTRGKRK